MVVTTKRTGSLPRRVWTEADSRLLGQNVVTAVVERVHRRGEDVNDRKLPGYSTTPVAFHFNHPAVKRAGRRMFQRGGEPMYMHSRDADVVIGNPMRAYAWSYGPDDVKASRSQARRTRNAAPESRRGRADWVIVGRRFPGGYKQFQEEGRGAPRKQLIVTGELERSWGEKDVSATHVIIGMRGEAARYGTHLNNSKHSGNFAGLSPRDRDIVRRAFRVILRQRAAASRPPGGGAP